MSAGVHGMLQGSLTCADIICEPTVSSCGLTETDIWDFRRQNICGGKTDINNEGEAVVQLVSLLIMPE